jgi:hypothetical protein
MTHTADGFFHGGDPVWDATKIAVWCIAALGPWTIILYWCYFV